VGGNRIGFGRGAKTGGRGFELCTGTAFSDGSLVEGAEVRGYGGGWRGGGWVGGKLGYRSPKQGWGQGDGL